MQHSLQTAKHKETLDVRSNVRKKSKDIIAYSVLNIGRIRIGSGVMTYNIDEDGSKDGAGDSLSVSGIVHTSDELLVAGAI